MRAAPELKPEPHSGSASLRRKFAQSPYALLQGGADERSRVDPNSGCNLYGVAPNVAEAEVHFGSSTASPLSPRGRLAVEEAWRSLTSSDVGADLSLGAWFEDIRARILAWCGDPDADCILAPSGTEAELLALAIACACWGRPVSNIVLAPEETGSGVSLASVGAHFLDSSPHSADVRKGARLAGWENNDFRFEPIEIRCADGRLRDAEDVDQEAEARARAAIAQGRGVLVHLLDVSKTGASALSVAAARRIRDQAPDRTLVVADCCQLRSSPARLKELANSGFMVALTGSKFAGGPPFSGALLVPRGLLDRMKAAALPDGLGAHSARLDWPADCGGQVAAVAKAGANLGLGLRWSAALSEMERCKAISDDLSADIHLRFAQAVQGGVAGLPGSRLLWPTMGEVGVRTSIVPILLRQPNGIGFTRGEASALQCALRRPISGAASGPRRAFHVGQPVRIGAAHALRICLSAPLVNDIADRARAGMSRERAFAPLAADLGDLFDKWASIWKTMASRK